MSDVFFIPKHLWSLKPGKNLTYTPSLPVIIFFISCHSQTTISFRYLFRQDTVWLFPTQDCTNNFMINLSASPIFLPISLHQWWIIHIFLFLLSQLPDNWQYHTSSGTKLVYSSRKIHWLGCSTRVKFQSWIHDTKISFHRRLCNHKQKTRLVGYKAWKSGLQVKRTSGNPDINNIGGKNILLMESRKLFFNFI